jgi:hypothetical protein
MITDFVEPEDVHAIVMPSDFEITIAGSVPLIHDFYDVDPTLAPIKTSGCRFEIRMRLDLNAHDWIHGITRSRRPILGLVLRHMPPPNHCDCDDANLCGDVGQ